MWAQAEAIELCGLLELIAPQFGAHVALTGGTLYKEGARKDVDILFYRIRQRPEIDDVGLLDALVKLGFVIGHDTGWCCKTMFKDRPVDLLFPERNLSNIDPLILNEYQS